MAVQWTRAGCLVTALLCGCASLTPRFSQNVAASFASQPMRKLVTTSLEVYYPERRQVEALRIAARLERCVEQLRTLPVSKEPRARALIFLTDSVFNNAYVQPLSLGLPQQMVLPDHMTLEIFNWFELGVGEIEDISCHESVHYVHLQQTDGLIGVLNDLVGGIWQPNTFTESWFLEGLATYYEGRLDKEVGRPHSMFWRGLFDSGAAELGGKLNAGFLSSENRDALPFGGNYLVGQRFVEYLARTYGDAKLWRFIDVQGHSIASPLAVTLRFRAVYGKTLGVAFDDFLGELARTAKLRQRPARQEVLQGDEGYLARLAGSPVDSAYAVVSIGRADPARVTVCEADGIVRFTRRLTQIFPARQLILADPELVSGMSFSADGAWLYLMSADVAEDGSYESKLLKLDATTGAVDRLWSGIDGFGGSVSPDGKAYVYVQMHGDVGNLYRLDLATNQRVPLTQFTGRESLGAPAWGPDGRIAFSRWMGEGWDLWLREPDGRLEQVTHGTFNYGAQWVDAHHLLALGAVDGRWQVQRLDLDTGASEWLTDAPYIALDPALAGGRVVFLNRVAWSWSVDTVPLPELAPATVQPEAGGPASATSPVALEPPHPPLPVVSDTPYSSLEHLFIPTLRAPFVIALPQISPSGGVKLGAFASASLMGSDRLGFHNYAANVIYYSASDQLQISAAYGNYAFAPWFTQLSLVRLSDSASRDLEAHLSTSKTFWTTPVTLGVHVLDRTNFSNCVAANECIFPDRVRLAGPSLDVSYFAGEATAYGGTQRGLGLSLSAAGYPALLGSSVDMGDLAAEVDAFLPVLPLGRSSLLLIARGRALPGAPPGLLQVGGVATGTVLAAVNQIGNNATSPIDLPQDIAFVEGLRGYEDFPVRATEAGIFSGRYRVPWIFDWGTTATFYLLPSFFLEQIDFEVFGAGALTPDSPYGRYHRAAGAAALIRTLFGGATPLTLYAQFAYRFDDALPPLFFVGVALE